MNEKLENYKYFSKSLIFLLLAQAISLLIRMGSRIIIARFSSPEIYGLFSVIWNEMTFVSTIVLLGWGQKLTIDLPREEKKDRINSISSALIYASIIGILSLIVSIILYLTKQGSTYKYSILLSAFFVGYLFIQFIFIGLKDFFGYFLQVIIQSLSMFILIVCFRNIFTIDIMVYVTFASIALSIIISLVYLLIKSKFTVKSISLTKVKIFKFSRKRIYLFIVDLVNSFILYLLLKLPQVIVNNSMAGYINASYSLMAFLLILPQMISLALGPKISQDFHNARISQLHESFRISLSLLYIFQGITIIIFAYFGSLFITSLYGDDYTTVSSLIFYGFLFTIIIDSFNYPYALYIRNTNNEFLFAIGKVISLVFFIIAEVIMLFTFRRFLIFATPIAYLISVLTLLIFYFFYTLKLNSKIENKDIRKLLLWIVFISVSFISALLIGFYIEKKIYLLLFALSNIAIFLGYLVLSKTINVKSLFLDIKEMIISINNRNKTKSVD